MVSKNALRVSLRADKVGVAIHKAEFAFKFRRLPRSQSSLAMTANFVILSGVH